MDSQDCLEPPDIKVKFEPEYFNRIGPSKHERSPPVFKTEGISSKVNKNYADFNLEINGKRPFGVWDVLQPEWTGIGIPRQQHSTDISHCATVMNKELDCGERLRMPAELRNDLNDSTLTNNVSSKGDNNDKGPIPVAMFVNTANVAVPHSSVELIPSTVIQSEFEPVDHELKLIQEREVKVKPECGEGYAKPSLLNPDLVALAVMDSKNLVCTASDCYEFIRDYFPYYKTASTSWRSSVRKTLSTKRHKSLFLKVDKDASDELTAGVNAANRGNIWTLNLENLSIITQRLKEWKEKDMTNFNACVAYPEYITALIEKFSTRPPSLSNDSLPYSSPELTSMLSSPLSMSSSSSSSLPIVSVKLESLVTTLQPRDTKKNIVAQLKKKKRPGKRLKKRM